MFSVGRMLDILYIVLASARDLMRLQKTTPGVIIPSKYLLYWFTALRITDYPSFCLRFYGNKNNISLSSRVNGRDGFYFEQSFYNSLASPSYRFWFFYDYFLMFNKYRFKTLVRLQNIKGSSLRWHIYPLLASSPLPSFYSCRTRTVYSQSCFNSQRERLYNL